MSAKISVLKVSIEYEMDEMKRSKILLLINVPKVRTIDIDPSISRKVTIKHLYMIIHEYFSLYRLYQCMTRYFIDYYLVSFHINLFCIHIPLAFAYIYLLFWYYS